MELSRHVLSALVLSATAVLGASCVIIGTISDAGGGGQSETGAGGAGAAGGSSGAGAGSGECSDAAQCGGVDTACSYRTCTDGACGIEQAAAGTACSDSDGQLCDGAGTCVECVDDDDCGAEVCQQNLCVPLTCVDGVQSADETDVDCGGSCAPCANGSGCGDASDCVSGFCDATSTCAACGAGDCGAGLWCNGGVCDAQKVDGDLCGSAAECLNGYCPSQDGVCCNAACDTTCVACLGSKTGGATGECNNIGNTLDPDGECTDEGAATCGVNGTGCNAAGACILYASGYTCAPAGCSGGVEFTTSQCDGSGTCSPGSAGTNCFPYVCGSSACLTDCNSGGDADCTVGYECSGGSCVPAATCQGAGPTTTPLDAEEQAMLTLINNHRMSNGAAPLTPCVSLNRAAQGHSEDMRDQDYFSHTGLNSSTPSTRACAACYDYGCNTMFSTVAENIAAGNSGAAATFDQWLNSPGHNANMLNSSYTVIGFGRATGGGTYGTYWTNKFSTVNEASCN